MRIQYSNRLFLYLPFVLLLVLALVATLRWWQVANKLEQQLLEANRGRAISPGITLHFASEAIGGIPFNLDAVLGDVTITVRATHGPFVWHTEHLAIHALTYGRAQEVFEAAGTQSLSWTDWSGQRHRFGFVPGSLRASAIATDGRLARFDLDLNGIGARGLIGGRAQLHFRKIPSRDVIDCAISVDALHFAPEMQIGFGPDIARVSISGQFVPATAFSRLLAGADEWRNAAETWRLGGGSFHLDHLDLAAGKLVMYGSGRLTLDSAHRPQGSLDLTLVRPQNLSQVEFDDFRLARALLTLSKTDLPTGPLHALASLEGGSASLSRKDATQVRVSAGSIDPLY